MARFKFGRKKKDHDADISMNSGETQDDDLPHSYLRRPSISSKTQRFQGTGAENMDENGSYEVSEDDNVDSAPAANGVSVPSGGFRDTNRSTPWKRHKLFDSPFPRYRHAASAVSSEKNEILLMGGLKEGSVFGDTWKIVPQISPSGREIDGFIAEHVEVVNDNNPPARVGHASVLCGNAYIIYGGDTVDTDYNGFPDDNFYMFNVNNKKYTIPSHILNKPKGRYGHQLGVVSQSASSSRLYLFGGQLENDVYDDLYYFELTSFKSPKARWELVQPLNGLKPPPLTNHSMCVYKHKIYVFGGVYNNEKVSNDVWCFDTNNDRWSQIHTSGDVPSPVNEHSACIVADNLYVYGGNDFSGAIYNTLHCLNLHTLKWTVLSEECAQNGPGARCGHSMTYIPKLNKLLVMGGDKNDYIYSQASNYDTYESFDGQELGTMIFELDVDTAHHLMNGAHPRKVAASAGGAAGILNRRAASPSPSEDALTRHRRSISAGPDDFQTPNASVERLNRSLDPSKAISPHSEPYVQSQVGSNLVSPLVPNSERDLAPDLAPTLENSEKFVDVDVASSSATSINGTQDLDDIRESYIQESSFSGNGHDILPDRVGTATPDFSRNFETFDVDGDNVAIPPKVNGAVGALGSRDMSPTPELATAALAPTKSLKSQSYNRGSVWSPTRFQENGDDKSTVAQLTAELNELKASAASQMEQASTQIQQLQQRNTDLERECDNTTSRQTQNHQQILAEKDSIIGELKRAVDPADLEITGNEGAEPLRGFTELTKYKLNRLDLMNKLAYVENENAQLKEKHAHFEPFMNNQMGELASLQKIIKAQEERIAHLTSEVRSESVLHREITDWKHKYEDLELEYTTYRNLNAEVAVSDDEAGNDPESRDLVDGSKKKASAISANLSSLVTLWQTNPANQTRSVPQDDELVKSLQGQIDDLLKTSTTQHQGSSTEVQILEEELQAKLASLKTFEENYRDALQSVKNTSKALDMTQDELKSQKLTLDKLSKENNELKMFKKAASASKKHSFQVSDGGLSNGSSPVDMAEIPDHEHEEEFTSAHYNMRLKDLEADLYIMKQDRDQLNDQVATLKKELYLAKS